MPTRKVPKRPKPANDNRSAKLAAVLKQLAERWMIP